MGKVYLTNLDFLKNGVPASAIATMVMSQPWRFVWMYAHDLQVVATVGYALMRLVLK